MAAILMNEKFCILIPISLEFVAPGPMTIIPANQIQDSPNFDFHGCSDWYEWINSGVVVTKLISSILLFS